MDVYKTFQNLINEVQHSCISYKIEMSPFSAPIFLKKSYIKDAYGYCMTPVVSKDSLNQNRKFMTEKYYLMQEKVIQSLRDDYGKAVEDGGKVYKTNAHLKNEIEFLKAKLAKAEDQIDA